MYIKDILENGDKVVIVDEKPNDDNWIEAMNDTLGREVTIESLGVNGFKIKETMWYYLYSNIKSIVNIEKEERRLQGIEEEQKKVEKLLEGLLYKGEDVEKIAISVFGEERVECVIKESKNQYNIIIHFPEITISNKRNESHPIKDIYVKVSVGLNPLGSVIKARIHLSGMRTTFTLKEIASGYSHSHLTTDAIGVWGSFCIGSDSLQLTMNNLGINMLEEDWYLLFFSIERYLSWESVDTTPYILMNEIHYGREIPTDEIKKELARILDKSPKELWSFSNGIEFLSLHSSCREFFNKNSNIKDVSNSSGSSIDKDMKRYMEQVLPQEVFIFKGKAIPYVIINDVEAKDNITQDLLNSYSRIINDNLQTFNKKLEYERKREEFKKTRQVGIEL